jgi:hypothetical protein
MTDRGVSTVLGYVLGLAIVTALVGGLFITTEIVSQERERAAESELRVLGNLLAADITTLDRLAFSARDARARLVRDLPEGVAGGNYRIQLTHDGSGPGVIKLVASDPDVSVTVPVMNGTAIGNSTASGGGVEIRYDGRAVVIEDV